MVQTGKAVRYLSSTALVVALSMGATGAMAQTMDCSQMHDRLDAALSQNEQLGDAKREQVRSLLDEAEQAEAREACIEKLRQANAVISEETGEPVIAALAENGGAVQSGGSAQGSGEARTTEARTEDGGKIVVQQEEPQVQVDPKDPQVDVTQRAPEVTVTQPKPEITVTQRKPTVDVQQPAPEITVTQAQPEVTVQIPEPQVEITMPEPDVNVDTQQPDVQVSQPEPTINFVRPEPEVVLRDAEPQVDVERAEAEVDVQTTEDAESNVQMSQAEPEVSFDSEQQAEVNVSQAEPKIDVQQADEAKVTVEQDRARVQVTRTGEAQRNADEAPDAGERELARDDAMADESAEQTAERAGDAAEQTAEATGETVQEGVEETGQALDRAAEQTGEAVEQTAEETGQALDQTADESGRTTDQAARETGEAGGSGGTPEEQPDPQVTAVREHPLYNQPVNTIVESDVYGATGNDIGDVEDVAVQGDRLFAIVEVGGFLGIADQEVAVPLDNLSYANDRLVLYNMTEEDLENMPEFEEGSYATLDRQGTVGEGFESRR